jgi:exosortase A
MNKSVLSETPSIPIPSRWISSFILFTVGLLIIGTAYWKTALGLGTVWTESSDFSHGWLIIPIVAWLVWNNRAIWSAGFPKPSILGLGVGLLFGLIWLLGDVARVSVVRQLGLIGFLVALSLLVFGAEFVRKNLFAFCFLFFAVPAGEALNPVLMRYTADATVWALVKTGLPVYREGLHFILPTGSWSVVDACSGLRYLICSIILGLLFAQFNYRTLKQKTIFLMVCILLSIIANWFRAYSVVMVGHLSHMKYGTGDDHVWYGWVFFGAMMLAIFWVGVKFGDPTIGQRSKPVSKQSPAPVGVQSISPSPAFMLTLLLGIAGIVGWSFLPEQLKGFKAIDGFSKLVTDKSGFSTGAQFPFKAGFTNALNTSSGLGKHGSHFQVSYFAKQDTPESEMFAVGNRLVPEDQKFARILEESRQSAPSIISVGPIREYTMLIGNQPWIVWHWFAIDQYGAADAYSAKAYRALSMLRGRGDHSVLIAVAQPGLKPTAEIRKKLADDAAILMGASQTTLATQRN